LGQQGRISQRSEFHPPHFAPIRQDFGGNLAGQPSLADAARPGDGDKPDLAKQNTEIGHFALAADESGQLNRQRRVDQGTRHG